MRRRARAATSPGVSLFPFLAVLICTMGALIVLLVVIARQSRLHAAASRDKAAGADVERAQVEREMLQWRAEQLSQSRDATRQQLGDETLRLSGIEEHLRQLRDRYRRLQDEARALAQQGTVASRDAIAAELDSLQHQMVQAKHDLEETKHQASKRQHSYAIIPFEGPNQTRRRPIYIECRAETIVLQPEGVELTARDFVDPSLPGNPLAAALRATREYYLEINPGELQESGEPYPLMIVRPDGIAGYYVARAAMTSWGPDFGYEFISQDWRLEFPQPDPRLAELQRRAVAEARSRQAELAIVASRRFGSEDRPIYRAAPGGGGLIVEKSGSLGSSPFERREAGGTGHGLGGGTEFGEDGPNRGSGRAYAGSRESSTSKPEGTNGGDANGGASQNQGNASVDSGEQARHSGDGNGNGDLARPMPNAAIRANAASHGQPGVNQETGSGNGIPSTPGTAPGHGGSSSTPMTGTPPRQMSPRAINSMAKSRGQNWGVPEAGAGAIPITRPVRVKCSGDKLTIERERGIEGREIPLEARTEQAIDNFVDGVREHIKSWGIAGRGMYWRPVLIVEVEPTGEGRFADLQTLLSGSGFDVTQK